MIRMCRKLQHTIALMKSTYSRNVSIFFLSQPPMHTPRQTQLLKILEKRGPMMASEIARELGLRAAVTHHHLYALRLKRVVFIQGYNTAISSHPAIFCTGYGVDAIRPTQLRSDAEVKERKRIRNMQSSKRRMQRERDSKAIQKEISSTILNAARYSSVFSMCASA